MTNRSGPPGGAGQEGDHRCNAPSHRGADGGSEVCAFFHPAGTTQKFERIVVGAETSKTHPGLKGEKSGVSFPRVPGNAGQSDFISYEIDVPMKDDSFASFNQAEPIARTLTFSRISPWIRRDAFQSAARSGAGDSGRCGPMERRGGAAARCLSSGEEATFRSGVDVRMFRGMMQRSCYARPH